MPFSRNETRERRADFRWNRRVPLPRPLDSDVRRDSRREDAERREIVGGLGGQAQVEVLEIIAVEEVVHAGRELQPRPRFP